MVNVAAELDRMAPDGREKDEALAYLETASMWAHKAIAEGFHPNPYDRSIEAMKAYPGDPTTIIGLPSLGPNGPYRRRSDGALCCTYGCDHEPIGHVCNRECNHD